MEGNGLGLDLALLNIDLVAGQDNGDVLADTDEIAYVLLVRNCGDLGAMTYGASWGRSCM